MTPERRLTYDFMELPFVIRLQVATKLRLTRKRDNQLTERERIVLYFKRAKREHKLPELRKVVDAHSSGK